MVVLAIGQHALATLSSWGLEILPTKCTFFSQEEGNSKLIFKKFQILWVLREDTLIIRYK